MLTETDYQAMLDRGWIGGKSDGTLCGSGSTLANTESAREAIIRIVSERRILSVCDAGAGDLHWISKIQWPDGLAYQAFDWVPRAPCVRRLDIRTQTLPRCDLILCRFVLGHMNPEWVKSALELFRHAGRYLLATTHPGENPTDAAVFNRWNLAAAPFGLGEPMESVKDCKDSDLALWELA